MKTITFDFTGAVQQWTVPTGISQVTVEVYGGAGYDSSNNGNGGLGAYVKAQLGVIAGQVLDLYVAGRGDSVAGGWGWRNGGAPGQYTAVSSPSLIRGGGGGGASAVVRSGSAMVIAGGGGGAGGGSTFPTLTRGNGGGGGIPAVAGSQGTQSGGGGGGAATASANGAGGSLAGGSTGTAGSAGSSGVGGAGGYYQDGGGARYFAGGGGGGGSFGGGGGGGGGQINAASGLYPAGGGGGGGSSHANGGTPIQFLSSVRGSNGRITVSYNEAAPSTPFNITPASGSILNVDDPTLTAQFSVNTLTQAAARVEWSLASDAAFTQNVRSYVQPTNASQSTQNSLASYKVGSNQADQRLFQGTWYIRARTIDANGTTSSFSSVHSFRVEHPPTTLNWYPTNNIAITHVDAGVTLAWDFISVSPNVDQIAYQVVVEQNNGVTVVDTGVVVSSTQQAVVLIPTALKGVQLRWRVRVWDSDNVMGPYSPNNLFRTADGPSVTIASMTTINTANPIVTFTATPAINAPIQQARLFITRDSDGAIVYDSGWR